MGYPQHMPLEPKFPPNDDYLHQQMHYHHHHLNNLHHPDHSPQSICSHNGYNSSGISPNGALPTSVHHQSNSSIMHAPATVPAASVPTPTISQQMDYYGNSTSNTGNTNLGYNYGHHHSYQSYHHHSHLVQLNNSTTNDNSNGIGNNSQVTTNPANNNTNNRNNNNNGLNSVGNSGNDGYSTESNQLATVPVTSSNSSTGLSHNMNPYSATAAVTANGNASGGGIVGGGYYSGFYGGTAHTNSIMDLPIHCPNSEPSNTALGLQELGKFHRVFDINLYNSHHIISQLPFRRLVIENDLLRTPSLHVFNYIHVTHIMIDCTWIQVHPILSH